MSIMISVTTTHTEGTTTYLTIAGRCAGYYFPIARGEGVAAYFIPRPYARKGFYLGHFPHGEAAEAALAAKAAA